MLDDYYLIDVTLHTEAKPRQAILINGLGRSVGFSCILEETCEGVRKN